jgi:hypothetical protein
LAQSLPPHAAVDAIRQRQHLVVDQHGKCREGRDEWRRERLQPGVQVAILAGEIVAGIAHGGIGRAPADMLRRIDDEVAPVPDELCLGPLPQPGDIDGVPVWLLAPEQIADPEPGARGNDKGYEGKQKRAEPLHSLPRESDFWPEP